jgi:hypothetical protein
VDRDNLARGIDGTGTPNSPQPGDNDVGAYEWRPPCVPVTETCNGFDDDCDTQIDEGNPGGGLTCSTGLPGVCSPGTTACQSSQIRCVQNVQASTEVCDSLDNDCDGTTDEGFPNSDGDGLANCVDPDDDNDGAGDASDCAPLDAGSFGTPFEIQNLLVLQTVPTQITWTSQAIGTATRYEVATGLLTTSGQVNFPAGTCLPTVSAPPGTDSRAAPPTGQAWYYMVRSRNACGTGTHGSPARDTHPACP